MKLSIPCATNEHRICRGHTDREFLEPGRPVPDDYGVSFECGCPCHDDADTAGVPGVQD